MGYYDAIFHSTPRTETASANAIEGDESVDAFFGHYIGLSSAWAQQIKIKIDIGRDVTVILENGLQAVTTIGTKAFSAKSYPLRTR